jgi:hypothetical protein
MPFLRDCPDFCVSKNGTVPFAEPYEFLCQCQSGTAILAVFLMDWKPVPSTDTKFLTSPFCRPFLMKKGQLSAGLCPEVAEERKITTLYCFKKQQEKKNAPRRGVRGCFCKQSLSRTKVHLL